jgi:hypothetical protein
MSECLPLYISIIHTHFSLSYRQTHTHTQILSPSLLSLSLTFNKHIFLPISHTLSPSLWHALSLSLSLFCIPHQHTHTHSLSLSEYTLYSEHRISHAPSVSNSLTLSLSHFKHAVHPPSLSHTFTHTHTHTLYTSSSLAITCSLPLFSKLTLCLTVLRIGLKSIGSYKETEK